MTTPYVAGATLALLLLSACATPAGRSAPASAGNPKFTTGINAPAVNLPVHR